MGCNTWKRCVRFFLMLILDISEIVFEVHCYFRHTVLVQKKKTGMSINHKLSLEWITILYHTAECFIHLIG